VNVLSLFSGIGGLELGLERAGMTVVGQVEIDPYCRRVLAKHWPEVPRHDDVRTCVDWWRSEPRPVVHMVCGGFPCQPISSAGRRLGEADERWLWPWFRDVIRDLRPRYALLENVSALLERGAGVVLGDLAEIGYDAEWDCIPASAVGAPHRRDRWFGLAYPDGIGRHGGSWELGQTGRPEPADRGEVLAYTASTERPASQSQDLAPSRWRTAEPRERSGGGGPISDWWATEPNVGRVAHGVPARVDRLRALGNAVVPQVAEHVGRLILAAHLAAEATA
jgi:DNA (cytosine-5)-methyltransferase 1